MAAKKRGMQKKRSAKSKQAAPKAGKTAKSAKTKPVAAKSGKAAKPAIAPSQFATVEGGPWGQCFLPRAANEVRYWLAKSEPEVFSWDDLLAAPQQTTFWDGIRNFAARNFLRDAMRLGDRVFFYHSNGEPPAIVGICEVVREGYPDATAFDPKHYGYDEGSTPDAPTWYMVDVRAVEALARPVTLPMIKSAQALAQMALLRVGRLSLSPVTPAEWNAILAMSRA